MEQEIQGKVVMKTKKETIISLFKAGVKEIEVIARIAGSRPSYVGSVLQAEGLIEARAKHHVHLVRVHRAPALGEQDRLRPVRLHAPDAQQSHPAG